MFLGRAFGRDMTQTDWREGYAVEAAQDGRHAARTGKGTNPFEAGSREWAAFIEGYEGVIQVEQQQRALDRITKPLAAK